MPDRELSCRKRVIPNPATLKIGDSIRLLSVPEHDLALRKDKAAAGEDTSETTATAIERIIAKNPIVVVTQVDEFGGVWYKAELTDAQGRTEYHYVTLYDDDTWEPLVF